MSDTLQVADLVNGKLDVDSLAGVAMVGTTADTITNREGVEIDTLEGRLKKVGFEPPVAYAAGIEFLTPADAVKSFDNGGIVYGCLASSRPFTTTGNFSADEPNFFVIQDTGGSGNVRADQSNTYAPGTTQNFDGATANTLSVDGVDFTDKNAEQDAAIAILQESSGMDFRAEDSDNQGGGIFIFTLPSIPVGFTKATATYTLKASYIGGSVTGNQMSGSLAIEANDGSTATFSAISNQIGYQASAIGNSTTLLFRGASAKSTEQISTALPLLLNITTPQQYTTVISDSQGVINYESGDSVQLRANYGDNGSNSNSIGMAIVSGRVIFEA